MSVLRGIIQGYLSYTYFLLAVLTLPGVLLLLAVLLLILREEMTYRRLMQVERDRNTMLAILSHRLRTPLTATSWYTEMLQKGECGNLTAAQLEAIYHAAEGTRCALALIDRFLGCSRAKLGHIASNPTNVNLYEIVRVVLDSLGERIRKRELTVYFDEEPRDFIAYVDPMIAQSVFDVIISNATHYTKKGGLIRIAFTERHHEIIVDIEDNGLGIPENERRHIFEELFRGEKAKKTHATGAGLGLCLAQALIRKAHGGIEFTAPVPGKKRGTVFSVRLPKPRAQ